MKNRFWKKMALAALLWGAGLSYASASPTTTAPTTAPTTSATACTSSCPSTCAAQNHFGNQAQVALALAQPPSPTSSFSQGCLGGLSQLNMSNFSGLFSLSGALSKLEQQLINTACSTMTSTLNNEIGTGNNVLNFAMNPSQLESNALNQVSSTMTSTEQGALNTAVSPANNSVSTYSSYAGTAMSDANSGTGTALSGSWVNNLY